MIFCCTFDRVANGNTTSPNPIKSPVAENSNTRLRVVVFVSLAFE